MNHTTIPDLQLPLTPAVFHILLALADGERHGYSIMQEVARQSEGQVKMGPGTLYGTIKRLLVAGLIVEAAERPDPALDDERRRYYRLTQQGRSLLQAEINRLEAILRQVRLKELFAGGNV